MSETYDTIVSPTAETYKTLNQAYEFFNKELFNSELSTCLITMQRKSKARGYFSPERFEARDEDKHYIHEIALNPQQFINRTDDEIISTLVHEMVHLWQEENGNPPRRNYHNREWAQKMEEIGLIPSDTGEDGGAKTGSAMSHYINKYGKYARLVKEFLGDKKAIHYQDRPVIKPLTKSKNKIKYTCPKCGLNAWGKDEIKIICGNDRSELQKVNKL